MADYIYTWKGKDIETLSNEETKEALRQVCRDLEREREIRRMDVELFKTFAGGFNG